MLLAKPMPPWHRSRVQTDLSNEQDGTAEAVAKRYRELEILMSALNRWALTYDSKIPKRARSALAQYRTLLSATVVALRYSLQLYDADVEAALQHLETD